MRFSGVTSSRRLLRQSAMTIGYGNGLPHDRTGACRDPVTGGTGGSATPLDTAPAPTISSVTVPAVPKESRGAALPPRRPPRRAAIPTPASPPTAAINISRRLQTDEPPFRGRPLGLLLVGLMATSSASVAASELVLAPQLRCPRGWRRDLDQVDRVEAIRGTGYEHASPQGATLVPGLEVSDIAHVRSLCWGGAASPRRLRPARSITRPRGLPNSALGPGDDLVGMKTMVKVMAGLVLALPMS